MYQDKGSPKTGESEKLLSVLFSALEQASDAVIITNRNGEIIYANPAYEKGSGHRFEDLKGKIAPLLRSDYHSADLYRQLWETILAGRTWRGRIVHRHPEGRLITAEVTIFPVRDEHQEITHFVILERDVTWEQELESYLQQVAKLEAISQLAGGIAHEFNNILTAISGYAELLLIKDKPEPRMRKALEAICTQAKRASYLISQLLDFSRQTKTDKKLFDLAAFLHENFETFRKWAGPRLELKLESPKKGFFILGSELQFKQIFFNLLINAREAMKEGGEVSLVLSEGRLPESFFHPLAPKPASRWAKLVISDNGPGMASEITDRIFEPFFSTKSEATGLGLAQVYGIVRQHEGFVRVSSVEGKGTTFEIYLPLVEKEAIQQKELFPMG